ncbi:MAG: bifunctional 2',3'-cyclic-nucleotide 2'-phosphodiesterase/3'-nucleotidase [Nitriliruptoraceae bacterium]
MFRATSLLAMLALIGAVLMVVQTAPAQADDQPESKTECRDGGWQELGFKNLGRCIAAVASEGRANPQGPPTHDLALLATTDIHAHLRAWDYYNDTSADSLGLSKTFTLVEEARAEHDNTLLLDAGDNIQGAFIGEFVASVEPLGEDEVHPTIAAMNVMGYDAATLGNHEFDFGLEFLEQILGDADFPSISANVFRVDEDGDITDEPLVDPYVVIDTEVDGRPLSVGVIGITPPGIMTWHGEKLEGLVDTIPAMDALERYLPELEDEGVDVTVLNAHSGKGLQDGAEGEIGPEGEGWLWSAAEEFQDELDAIMLGHAHGLFPGDESYDDVEGLDNERGLIHGVPAVMPGSFGDHLGKIQLELTRHKGEWSVSDGWAENLSVTADTAEHEAVVDAVDEHHQATVEYVRSEVGETEVPISHYFSRTMDSKALEIVNEAQIWWGEDRLAGTQYEDLPVIAAAAPFRAGREGPSDYTHIPEGPVSIRDLADLYIYPNEIRIVQLDGDQVIDWLEHAAQNFHQIDPDDTGDQELVDEGFPPYNWDVIDGIDYQIDVTQPVGERIVNATFEDEELTSDMDFAVVTNNYRAGGGGDFPHLDGTHTIVNSDEANRAVLISYVLETTPITEPADDNWSILPIEADGEVSFRSSPDAVDLIDDGEVTGVDYLETDGDGWGVYEYLFE